MNAPVFRVEGEPVDARLPKDHGYLYRISFDASLTSEEMVGQVRARGGVIDAVSDLFGIMTVFLDDASRLRGLRGILSVKHHADRDYW